MSERRKTHHAGFQSKWVLCPTCRRHTDFGNIAYVDDGQDTSCDASFQHAENSCEASVTVKGSYSTKVNFLIMCSHCLFGIQRSVNPHTLKLQGTAIYLKHAHTFIIILFI